MKRITTILISAMLVFACDPSEIIEFQSQNFIKYFGSGYESMGKDVLELPGGGYILTGYDKAEGTDNQVFVAKVDENGNLIWSNTYGADDAAEEGRVIREAADGFFIAGVAESTGEPVHSFILKIDAAGDSVWYREFGDPSLNIEINDIAVSGSSIFAGGKIILEGMEWPDFYAAKLTLNGDEVWGYPYFDNSGSEFGKLIPLENTLLAIGHHGFDDRDVVVRINLENGKPGGGFEYIGSEGESIADAVQAEDSTLFVLVNSGTYTKLYKYHLNLSDDLWQTDPIEGIDGTSFACNEDGTLVILGESITEGNTLINTIRVDAAGTAVYGGDHFKTFQGSVEKVRSTRDQGIVMIGSTTNETYGVNIQLLKTDKELFLMRP
ncbi:MAG: PQQ-like beta-propeller repeat protein [Bacteroidales bacterium]|nr:PQQ-like beta-propeller repeat protein [Bacteroidales bacterium]